MQVAQWQVLVRFVPLCKVKLVAAYPAPILVPKMVLTHCNLFWLYFSSHQLAQTYSHVGHYLQLALVMFACNQLAQILHLHSWWL